jgi:predicted nucleotide-binding protein (sugar kinase/HSP70/actin superfamily)
MKITFPHLGNTYVCVKPMLNELGIECILPPFNNKRALELGTRHVPEMACLPLKINIGNYIQARELGADTILMAGGCGPCRFGYYSEMHREILKDAGCDMEIITLEFANGNFGRLAGAVHQLTGTRGLLKIPSVAKQAVKLASRVDELEMLTFKIRARELEHGSVDRIYTRFRERARSSESFRETFALLEETFGLLHSVKVDKQAVPLKIGIVGEIYTGIEHFASFDIQEKLGGMGAEVDRKVTVSNWIIEHILKKGLHLPRDTAYAKAAEPWLGRMIGGHAQETLGHTVLYAQDRYDGVIQIFPFSCMPEIVAESILPSIEQELGIPVLTLIIDEMTGGAGYLTRVEAFVDMLERRRESQQYEGGWALSWN